MIHVVNNYLFFVVVWNEKIGLKSTQCFLGKIPQKKFLVSGLVLHVRLVPRKFDFAMVRGNPKNHVSELPDGIQKNLKQINSKYDNTN